MVAPLRHNFAVFAPIFRGRDIPLPLRVSDLIIEGGLWNSNLIREAFSEESANAILRIGMPYGRRQDKVMWIPDKKGIFFC